MKNAKLKFLSVTLFSLLMSAAFANQVDDDYAANKVGAAYQSQCKKEHKCWHAPEIDPAQALNALALLGGTVAIARGNRRKKK
jgi:hypothetical protein